MLTLPLPRFNPPKPDRLLGLIVLGIKFFQEIFHVLPLIISMKETEVVLLILSLIDIALVGGLLVMVMLSGYENFVSSIDIEEGKEKLSWLGACLT